VRKGRAVLTLQHAGAVVVAALFILPVMLLVAGSLREVGPAAPPLDLVPAQPTLENYPAAFAVVDLARQAWNSALLAVIVVPLSVIVAACAGFAMTRLPAAPQRLLVMASIAGAMLPVAMLIVGRFTLFRSVGATDTYLPIIATGLIGGSPFNVLLFYVAFRRMPSERFDAARLDGASAFRLLFNVGLPAARNVTLAVAVLAFAANWGNVLEPLVFLWDEDLHTLPLGLRSLSTLDLPNQPIMLAGAVLSLVVPLAFLLVALRWFVEQESETQ
jgi:multiple sugar transport system permease protein